MAPLLRNMDFILVNVSEMTDIKLVCWVLHDQHFPTYLLLVNKCDDEKQYVVASWNNLALSKFA